MAEARPSRQAVGREDLHIDLLHHTPKAQPARARSTYRSCDIAAVCTAVTPLLFDARLVESSSSSTIPHPPSGAAVPFVQRVCVRVCPLGPPVPRPSISAFAAPSCARPAIANLDRATSCSLLHANPATWSIRRIGAFCTLHKYRRTQPRRCTPLTTPHGPTPVLPHSLLYRHRRRRSSHRHVPFPPSTHSRTLAAHTTYAHHTLPSTAHSTPDVSSVN